MSFYREFLAYYSMEPYLKSNHKQLEESGGVQRQWVEPVPQGSKAKSFPSIEGDGGVGSVQRDIGLSFRDTLLLVNNLLPCTWASSDQCRSPEKVRGW